MTRPAPIATTEFAPTRKPRVLWANAYCLLDSSSGASMAIRDMLHRLAGDGYDVQILGAGVFDAPVGINGLGPHAGLLRGDPGSLARVPDQALEHELVRTADTRRAAMTCAEQDAWYSAYLAKLDEFRPDLVYFYGGQILEMILTAEARRRDIPCVAYLGNGNYRDIRWCHDVNLILTDSQATADHYQRKWGIPLSTIGAFIKPADVIAPDHDPCHVLAINPSLAKGGALVARIAMLMEKRRPDITFEIVESRSNWKQVLRQVTGQFDQARDSLDNVIVTPNTSDMRPVYGRARLLLALSLWWESFGRVVIEALYNGVPSIITHRGGLPEAAGDDSLILRLPEICYQPPYNRLPSLRALEPLIARIERCHDDPVYYDQLVQRARAQGRQHQPEVSYRRLIAALAPFLARQAGDKSRGIS